MNRRVIAFLLGHILLLEAAVMVPALVISLCMGEHNTAWSFIWTILLTAIVGDLPLSDLSIRLFMRQKDL